MREEKLMPEFNFESGKNNQEITDPYFLQDQIRLPKDQWSNDFKKLIEEKSRKNQQEKQRLPEDSPELSQKGVFNRYMSGLGIDEESLRDKRVLDLGCGDKEFVKHLIEKGITLEAYGLDIEIDESLVEERFKGHILQGNFEEDLPVKDVDYIVSVGAVSSAVLGGEETMNLRRIVEKALASLKEGGEIRIYPIQEPARETPLKGIQASQEKWEELLTEISETQEVECLLKPRNIKVIGENNDIILESVLIITRKK